MDYMKSVRFTPRNRNGKILSPNYYRWVPELVNSYIHGNIEDGESLVTLLTNVSSTSNYLPDTLDKDLQIFMVEKEPKLFRVIKYPVKKTIDLIIKLKGDIGRTWVEQQGKEFGWYDAYLNGGLR